MKKTLLKDGTRGLKETMYKCTSEINGKEHYSITLDEWIDENGLKSLIDEIETHLDYASRQYQPRAILSSIRNRLAGKTLTDGKHLIQRQAMLK